MNRTLLVKQSLARFGLLGSFLFASMVSAQPQTEPLLTPNQVKIIQQELEAQGYRVGPIDGVVGEHTTQAIRDFQQRNGQNVTGKLDPKTIASLDHESLPQAHKHEEAGISAEDQKKKDKNLDPELFDDRFTGSNTQGDTGTGSGV
jgi:peptidoglycan hydrolase-like protein with peptidoglycan-binding domain